MTLTPVVAVTERSDEFHHVVVAHLAKDFGLTLCGLLVAKPHLQYPRQGCSELSWQPPAGTATASTSRLAPEPSKASKTKF